MKKLICPYCERNLPNIEHKYKNECIWCSIEYFELTHPLEKKDAKK